ncbi:MAG: metallophosphoesterase [Clostridiales bacterium]|nr:metallophosphoesterase [Clostridiales bacterium]
MNILGRIFALCLSVFYTFNPMMTPSDKTPMKASADCRLKFIAWADPQISNYILKRDPIFVSSCEDVKNSKTKFDAMLIAGDIVENGLPCETEHVTENLPKDNIKNFVLATGNHDVRLHPYKQTVKRFTAFTNGLNEEIGSKLRIDALHYKTVINGYTFIVLGTDKTMFEEAYLSDSQLSWLDDSLKEASKSGKPIFVTVHQPFKKSHGLPKTWNSPTQYAGSIGAQSDALKNVLKKYKKIILISGHLHTGIGEYTYQNIEGIHSVNLPSLCVQNRDGRVNDHGLGFWVEVFRTKVVFHARNFSEGKDYPNENITIKF